MSSKDSRRSYGTGSLFVRVDGNGRETWYGKWRANGRQVMRRIGLKRVPGTREGLTQTQAEAELRRLIAETQTTPPVGQRMTIHDVSVRYIAHATRAGRKATTIKNVESEVRVHLSPFFNGKTLDAIKPEDVADLIVSLERKALAPKTIRNVIGTLSALFNFARAAQRRWAVANPCEGAELPAVAEGAEIRFLTLEEVDALVRAARRGPFQAIDRAMYRTGAMTGLRQGELMALRWQDVDWTAQRIRVRQNYVLGKFDTPKSRRSTRSVPMADEVAGELERLFQRSSWQADRDLVFAHPETGGPLYKPGVLRRYRKALKAAELDETHVFHDLRHTFGTRMAAAGVPMRTLQEWMGHKDISTTQRYADYAPSDREADMVAAAFSRSTVRSTNLSESQMTEDASTRAVEPSMA